MSADRPARETPLRQDRDYRLLWTARTISITGSEVSALAVPLTAVTLLAAGPAEMGLLTAAASVPALLLGLQAGAIADRLTRHRPLMIACELVSCVAALSVPLAWLFGVLNAVWLIVVALVTGTAGVFFSAVNFPHLASVVPPGQRTKAMAGCITKRYGENRVLLYSILFFPSEIVAVAVIDGPLWGKLVALSLTSMVSGSIVVAFATCLGAILLRDTTPEFRGRVNATMNFGIQGVMALGSIVGGALADFIGLRPVLVISAIGIAFSTVWIWSSPLRSGQRSRAHDP